MELEATESEQTGLTLSFPLSPEHVLVNSPVEFAHEHVYPNPEARNAISFGLDNVLFTAVSDSEDFGLALADALPPSSLTNAAATDFTNLEGSVEQGFTAIPVSNEMLASYLSPFLSPSWKSRPLLPTIPCRITSAIIGKSYIAAGQAGMALHTRAILQAYQADVLKEMDEGGGLTPEAVKELCKATDLALRATKHTAHAAGHSMAGSVAAERHLWLNLTEIHEKENVFLLDAPISQTGLFAETVSSVMEKFRSATALRQFMPRRTRDHSNRPSSSLSTERSLPWKETPSRSSAPAHPPSSTVWGARSRPLLYRRQAQADWSEVARQACRFSSIESLLTFGSGGGEFYQKPHEVGPDRSNISARL